MKNPTVATIVLDYFHIDALLSTLYTAPQIPNETNGSRHTARQYKSQLL